MKKFLLLMSMASFAISAHAQTTFSILFTPDLDSAWNATASFFDADLDGDQDLFTNGGSTNGLISELLINDGTGHFTADPQQFLSVYGGKALTGDLDGDGDKDLYLTGTDGGTSVFMRLYENDGNGVFTADSSSGILPTFLGDGELFDSDGDADLDLLITGGTAANIAKTVLYLNDGAGNFTPAPVDFDSLGFTFSDITVGDVDADGDKDFFVCGDTYIDSLPQGITSVLFINNGGNNFSSSAQSFLGLSGAAQFSDYDNDSDLDLIYIGSDANGTGNSCIYNNNGSGQFSLNSNNPIAALAVPALKLFDADLDGDQDLFATGADDIAQAFVFNYYDNQGGNFVLVNGQPFVGIWAATIEPGDIDGDSDLDLYTSGALSPAFASLFVNMYNPLGVKGATMETFHGVYPNPIAHNQLKYSVEGLELGEAYDLMITDMQGRTIFQQENVPNQSMTASVELPSLQPGVYFLVLKSGTGLYRDKFIVVGN